MARQSTSPPPHRDRTTRDKYSDSRSGRYEESDGHWGSKGTNSRDKRPAYEPERSDRRRDYSERDRERERERDRDRYNRRRDDERDRSSGNSREPRSSRRRPRSSSKSPAPPDKAKPNFGASGLLAAETNTVKAADGTSSVLKYNEPPEARKPPQNWRLYVFKGTEQVELLHIHRQSAYLIGRDRLVADIPVDHPSCSKQHAVIQYRHVQQKDEFGGIKASVKPFIIDLESTNGTIINDEAIPAARYYELKAGDVIKIGQSLREYVLLHDEAA
ncbi:SMAD/FHA domain-containing protein [Pluteus cervinus]|uniref:SMAD/FHA domain-containing protein n=1 Tax=Pluteus cervinus TaxID=181527 RepID=A0ACD3AXE7_9AGAR|nr:SMAD/FHA domain-containing protein [Pluteus cervinus]